MDQTEYRPGRAGPGIPGSGLRADIAGGTGPSVLIMDGPGHMLMCDVPATWDGMMTPTT
ncbi:MAG: hypothetical protein AAF496_09265 [Pseudomonadota bacterium]